MRFTSLIVINALFGLSAFAGQTICEDQFEKRLRYSFERPDGGAPGPIRENLVLDKKVLIDTPSPEGKPEIQIASIEIKSPKIDYSMRTANNMYVIQTFSANALVTNNETQAILFDNVVLCRTSLYTGVPAP